MIILTVNYLQLIYCEQDPENRDMGLSMPTKIAKRSLRRFIYIYTNRIKLYNCDQNIYLYIHKSIN